MKVLIFPTVYRKSSTPNFISSQIFPAVLLNLPLRIFTIIFFQTGRAGLADPAAKPFVDWAFSKGYRIVIATDPLLPRKATHHRLRWVGFDPWQFELISTYECFHFSKTHPAYYAEVLGRLGWPEGPMLMVGNDLERDILPAKKLGLAAYHVDAGPASSFGPEAEPRGKLDDLRLWLESTNPVSLMPSFKSTDSLESYLRLPPR